MIEWMSTLLAAAALLLVLLGFASQRAGVCTLSGGGTPTANGDA